MDSKEADETKTTLVRCSFYGTPHQMGLQHGEALSDKIRDLAEERLSILLDGRPPSALAVAREASAQIFAEMRVQVPEVLAELQGVSAAAGVPFWKLVIAGSLTDLDHVLSVRLGPCARHHSGQTGGCTLLRIRRMDGRVLVAGTWDSHASAQHALALVERAPTGGVRSLALTTAGWPMQQGVTSAGLAFAVANLVPVAAQRGITYVAALPHATAARSLDDAVSSLALLRLCSGRYFVFADAQGAHIGIESDGIRNWRSDESVAHTNHYLFADAVASEGRPQIVQESEARRRSAIDLAARIERESPSDLADALKNTFDGMRCVSKQGVGREERTCACFVLDPFEMCILFTVGPPGQGEEWSRASIEHT